MPKIRKLDPELVKILICPKCRGDIEYRETDEEIVCLGECKSHYPVIDGIPHMRPEDGRQP